MAKRKAERLAGDDELAARYPERPLEEALDPDQPDYDAQLEAARAGSPDERAVEGTSATHRPTAGDDELAVDTEG